MFKKPIIKILLHAHVIVKTFRINLLFKLYPTMKFQTA